MRHHPAWLAAGLLVFVVLACNLSKNTNNSNSNSSNSNNSNSNSSTDTDLGSGVAIEEIHMARDKNGAPGDETSSFAPADHTIHCVTTLNKPKSGTGMRFAWWIVDAGGSKNEKFKEIEYNTRGRESIVHGHLTLPKDWPIGKYKVQVYVNGDLDRTVFFSVQ